MIARVMCDLHRSADRECPRCLLAAEISQRILHEQGGCGGPESCFHCELTGGVR